MSTSSSPSHSPIRIDKGNPDSCEVAALNAVITGLITPDATYSAPNRDLWGNPVDRLHYPIFSWQRVTLLERTHMRR